MEPARVVYTHPTPFGAACTSGERVYASASRGGGAVGSELFTSADGVRWTLLAKLGGYVRALAAEGDVVVLAGSKPALSLSRDGGATFQRAPGPSVGERNALVRAPGGWICAGAAPHPVALLPDDGELTPIAAPKGLHVNAALGTGDAIWLFGDGGAVLRLQHERLDRVVVNAKLDLLVACAGTADALWLVSERALLSGSFAKPDLALRTVKTPTRPWSVATCGERLLVGAASGLLERAGASWRALWTSDDVVRTIVAAPAGGALAFTMAGAVLAVP